ncbi:MAG: FHA domain-containing protein [Gemmatales bacterium]|nr:FHA domain-containing protein [Gemmatales bacterium]MDW8223416.1 FHA domain-containing protein [Gemmatales bacterium]
MTHRLRIYYNGVFGAAGALFGWLLFGLMAAPDWPWVWSTLLGGATIGAGIGYWVVSWEAILDLSGPRFLRMGGHGLVFGAVGGAVGALAGEVINYALQDLGVVPATLSTMLARGLGWLVFGLSVGLADGWVARSWQRTSYGAVGGVLGGFVGGVLFALLLAWLGREETSYVWGQAVGLMILGACIGSLIAAVEEALKPATLRVLRGWREGREFPILKAETSIGRDEKADILLLRDMKVEKYHAKVVVQEKRYFLVNTGAPPQHTLVDGRPVIGMAELTEGARIQLGEQVLVFHLREARRQAPTGRERQRPTGSASETIPEAILLSQPPGRGPVSK